MGAETSSRDPGVGNERTALAWQRTALSLVAGSAVVARLTVGSLGPAALACLVFSALVGMWVLAESRGRYERDGDLRHRAHPRGGRAAFGLAAATTVVCLTQLVAVLH